MKSRKFGVNSFYFFVVVFFIFLFMPILNVKAITITTSTETLTGDSSYKKVTNTGTFSIYNAESSYEKSSFSLYKIVDVFYNSSENALKYQFTSNFKTFISSGYVDAEFSNITIDRFMSLDIGDAKRVEYQGTSNVVSGGHISSSEFSRLMNCYATYIKVVSLAPDKGLTTRPSTQTLGYVENTSVPIGTYLALPTNLVSLDDRIPLFAVMADSVRLEKSGSTWNIINGLVRAKISSTLLEHTISKSYSGSFASSAIVGFDDEPEGKISFAVPTAPANTIVSATVTIEKVRGESGWVNFITSGFTIDNFTLTGGTIKYNNNSVGTISRNSSTGQATIKFTNIKTLPNFIEFKYHAENLNSSNSIVGNNSRAASLVLDDPYATGSNALKGSSSRSVSLTTYALQITGTPGAEFQVKNSSGSTRGTVVIQSNGLGELKGLANGTYTVTQTKAPNAYTLISGSHNVVVGSGGEAVSGKNGYYNLTLKNTVLAVLPYTGSIGTIIFTVLGSLLVIGSIVLIIHYKKFKNKKDIA